MIEVAVFVRCTEKRCREKSYYGGKLIAFVFRFYASLLISHMKIKDSGRTNDMLNAYLSVEKKVFLLSHFIFYVILLPFQIEFTTHARSPHQRGTELYVCSSAFEPIDSLCIYENLLNKCF